MAKPKPLSRRVLFVEDETALAEAYRRFFARRYRMEFASTGAQALERFASFAPEVVVLDLRLPDTDGIDLVRKLRAEHPELPVVITSSFSSMVPLVEVMGIGHSGYLVKPFELSELGDRIDATL